MRRPRCSKCGGLMLPETTLAGDGETPVVISVGCINCGERFFRGVERRRVNGEDLKSCPASSTKSRRGIETCCG